MTEAEKAIKHFESLQKRYATQHNGKQCKLVETALDALRSFGALESAEKRIAEAVAILQTIEWVGSGAKGRIEDAIGVLLGIQEETE